MNLFNGSWKTTSTGLLAIIGAVVGLYFKRHNLDEGTVMAAVASIITGVGLLAARDNDKSSEQVGTKDTPKQSPLPPAE